MKGSLTRALVLVMVLSSTAFGQFSYDFTGAGARAEGMGKAFIAISDDVNAASWNPAGLYVIEKPVMGLSWGSLAPRGVTGIVELNEFTYSKHSGSFSDVSAANFASPFRIKGHPFVGSISYSRSFDIFQSAEWNAELINVLDTTINGILLRDTIPTTVDGYETFEGGLNVINFAIGTRLYDKLSVGLSVNVYTGSFLHVMNNLTTSENQPYNLQHGTWVSDYTRTDTSKFSGMNMVVGLKYSGEKTRMGLTVRTPFSLKVSSDLLIYNIQSLNGLIQDNFTDTLYFMDNVTKYDMPWIIGAGFAYNVKENWLVAADAELRSFSGGLIKTLDEVTINPGGDNIETYIEEDPNWNNVFTARLGTEYLHQTSFGKIPLRAGLGYCPTPDPSYDEFGDNSRTVIYTGSLGTGIHWSQICFDVAYSISTVDYHYYGDVDFTNRNHHLNVSFSGVF